MADNILAFSKDKPIGKEEDHNLYNRIINTPIPVGSNSGLKMANHVAIGNKLTILQFVTRQVQKVIRSQLKLVTVLEASLTAV